MEESGDPPLGQQPGDATLPPGQGSTDAALPPVPMEPLRERDPRELGGFRMLGRLGYGGMGVAYLAEQDGTWAVVKVVRSDLSDSSTFRARLVRELEAMRRATGPHTAAVLASDLDADPAWFAMEYIPGANLGRDIPERGPLSGSDLDAFAHGLADALAHVHAVGVIHRDLKPSNVMMSPTGPRLIDFGIAGMEEGTHLTRTGSIVGSTGWLAPEQVTGDPVSFATDVHAWALCVLFAATGNPPFGADTSTAAMYRVLETTPDIPASIGQPLRDLLTGAVAKDPAYRPSMDQVTAALRTGTTAGWAPPAPAARARTASAVPPAPQPRTRPAWLVPAAIAAVAIIAVALVGIAARGTNNAPAASPTQPAPSAPAAQAASTAASPPVSPSASPSASATPEPTYAVKVSYAGDAIPDKTFTGTLGWTFDVCSPDPALAAPKTTAAIRMYADRDGTWKPITAKPNTTKGGRCGPKGINVTIDHLEPPTGLTPDWTPCRKYRVVIPETPNFRKSNVDLCIQARAT